MKAYKVETNFLLDKILYVRANTIGEAVSKAEDHIKDIEAYDFELEIISVERLPGGYSVVGD